MLWLRRGAALLAGMAVLAPASGSAENYRCLLGGLIRHVEVIIPDPSRGGPCKVVYRKEVEEPNNPRVLWNARNDYEYCRDKAAGLVQKLRDWGWMCKLEGPDLAAAKQSPVASRPSQLDSLLEQAIARDLAQLKGSNKSPVLAENGVYGDLDGDGRNDAAVVITFDDQGDNHAQYLVAYLFNGRAFTSAASRFIGGRYRDVFGGELEAIEGGVIRLNLQVLEAEDQYCCPSGSRPAHYVLRGSDLVEQD